MKPEASLAAQPREVRSRRRLRLAVVVLSLGFLSGGIYLVGRIAALRCGQAESAADSVVNGGHEPWGGCGDDVVYDEPPPGFSLEREAEALKAARREANRAR